MPDHTPILAALAEFLRASYSAQDGPIDERTADRWRELAHAGRVAMDKLVSRARDAERYEKALRRIEGMLGVRDPGEHDVGAAWAIADDAIDRGTQP